jgi:TolB-like protein/tetratricopeptide (TPR) repeat protein/predicted Ser/Thr protein kinase
MIGQTISQYKILEKLGEGGMGVVYKAQDVKLNRVVALKFMPAASQVNEEDRQRFVQEAQSAALLNHPNVCTIHDIKDEGEHHFIVMEFVDGQTLRGRIYGSTPQRLEEKAAVGYAMQVGEALAEAHKHGIVHRDIKADNIMVNSRGQVKVMDFGLAKLKGSMKITRGASTIGTLGYMSPEQLRGEEADARSDIFSYGVLLFEMLTGRMPFRGEHEAAMMYSIMNEAPEPVAKYNPEISPDVERIVDRALEKDPEDRFQHIDDLVSELRRLQKKSSRIASPGSGANVPVPDLTATGGAGRGSGGTAVPGAPSSAAMQFAAVSGPDSGVAATPVAAPGGKKFPLGVVAGIGVLAVAVAVYFLMFTGKGEKIDSLAVLPFVNVSGDPDIEYLTEGVTDYLTNKLSQMPGLRVLPSSFVAKYRNRDIQPKEIGTELGVGAILTGKVTQRGGALSVQTELIDVGKVSQLWGERYEKKLSEIQDLQGDIVSKVSDRLGISLGSTESANLVKGSTKNAEAYQLYLKGMHQWNKRTTEGVKAAVGYFEKAIDLDPSFALAYVGYAQSIFFPGAEDSPYRVRFPKMKAAIDRALEIEEGLAAAHVSLASYLSFYKRDYEGAEKEYLRAIELNPNYATGLHWYAEYLCYTGRFDEGLAMYRRAVAADPLSLAIATDFGAGYYVAREYDSSKAYLENILKTDPEYERTHAYLVPVYLQLGEDEKNYQVQRWYVMNSRAGAAGVARFDSVWKHDGLPGLSRLFLSGRLRDTSAIDPPYMDIASAYLMLGKPDSALPWIRKSIEAHDPYFIGIGVTPLMDPLRGNPEFDALVREVGLQEVQERALARKTR